jgi:hypothetical protein
MKIELSDRDIHTLILALQHAKSTVAKALQAEQTAWKDDANYLRYSSLEAKLKATKPQAA